MASKLSLLLLKGEEERENEKLPPHGHKNLPDQPSLFATRNFKIRTPSVPRATAFQDRTEGWAAWPLELYVRTGL